MLHDKRQDLDAEKQKRLLERMVAELSRENPELYYRATSDIAQEIRRHVDEGARLNADERELLARLTPKDIQMILSLH